jgi:hypothetical protein
MKKAFSNQILAFDYSTLKQRYPKLKRSPLLHWASLEWVNPNYSRKVDLHTYPSGTTVVKALISNDFIFYDKKQCIIKDLNDASLTGAALVKITWWIQKNHQKTNQSP